MQSGRMVQVFAAAAGGAFALYLFQRARTASRFSEPVTPPSIAPTESSANRVHGQLSRAQNDADLESYDL